VRPPQRGSRPGPVDRARARGGAPGEHPRRERRAGPRLDVRRHAARGGVGGRRSGDGSLTRGRPRKMAAPIALVATTTDEILSAKPSRLCTAMTGRTDTTPTASVITTPAADAPFSHAGEGTPPIGIANITR